MTYRQQYIEALIRLIELNEDDQWTETFPQLRTGGGLPGGGAGSLNDWGPVFSGEVRSVWLTQLYQILRFLFDKDLAPEQISNFSAIKTRKNLRIIRCLKCGGSYQHPAAFEAVIALEYYDRFVPVFSEQQRLVELLEESVSFNENVAIDYRNWLKAQYSNYGIQIFDFVAAKYECPHCSNRDFATEHDLYRITESLPGALKIELTKKNADWKDFQND